MKMTAKLLSVLLCAAMLISLLPITVSAAVLGDLQYEVKDDHVVITLCRKTATSVDIPAQIDGLPVTEIGGSAFEECNSLKSVTIPSSVTTIDYWAFGNCDSLTKIIIPEGVTIIDRSAFDSCENLTSVTLPNSLTKIGETAFAYCYSLSNIKIPNNVTSIGYEAFNRCGYYNNTKNWKNGVLYIGDWLIDADGDTIPSNYTIASGTRGIADNAFYQCKWLESVTIPDSVSNMGRSVFGDCINLTNVNVPKFITNIGEYVFYNCPFLTSVTIPDNVTSIGAYAFSGCSALTSITIPRNVTSIGKEAFYGCNSLERVEISDLVSWCSIVFGDAYAHPFYSSESVDRGIYINGNKLTDITIPNGVTSIGGYAFCDCVGITSVTMPSSVTSIGRSAFSGCYNLATVYYSGSEAQWENIYINGGNSELESATIHYLGTDEGDPKPPVIEYPYTINGLSLVSVSGEALTAPPSDSAFMVNVELEKTKSRSAQDYLFVAVYDTRGALLSLNYVRANFTYNSGLEFGFYVPAQTRKIGSIKAFVWTGFNTEQPLCESVEIKN